VVAEGSKEVKKAGDGKAVKDRDIDKRELHGRSICWPRRKEKRL
jgi:hypothetical protein